MVIEGKDFRFGFFFNGNSYRIIHVVYEINFYFEEATFSCRILLEEN